MILSYAPGGCLQDDVYETLDNDNEERAVHAKRRTTHHGETEMVENLFVNDFSFLFKR